MKKIIGGIVALIIVAIAGVIAKGMIGGNTDESESTSEPKAQN